MRRTDQRCLVFRQEFIRRPVEGVPNVHAEVLVRVHVIAFANDEATKRPVAVTDFEFTAAGTIDFVQATDRNEEMCS